MSDQIILAWTVQTQGTSLSAAQAATALGAVPLYQDVANDPLLGQLLGLTVASDVTTAGSNAATRTLTLNMTAVPGAPTAPPVFPCHPDTSTPAKPPYFLRRAVTLPGDFQPTRGSAVVPSSASQIPSAVATDKVQFLSQEGVFYTILSISSSAITLTTPYTGRTAETTAFRLVADPIRNDPTTPGRTLAVLYSSSFLDVISLATFGAGSGAQTISLVYRDSTGAGPFTATTSLTGRLPNPVALAGGIDISEILSMQVASTGAFLNNVGQITLAELDAPYDGLVEIPIAEFLKNQTLPMFQKIVDAVQSHIVRSIVYLPPSYFALAQQAASQAALAGDFLVTTGTKHVLTSVDQTGTLSPGNKIEFASQPGIQYTVDTITPAILTLTAPYTGFDFNKRDSNNEPRPTNQTALANNMPTGACLVYSASAPTNAQLAAVAAEYVNPGDAFAPADAMAPPVTVSPGAPPNYLSGLYSRTLSLALAVPVVQQPITFA